ncbi:ssDNA endodeoxyribonuclease [Cichlidogyrus casuarinus]|uniref:SsDNA endodeoxyribonuclease n=1 Tax=Cichlidogyrus casuarinus TaxID=1844966 RepID=A0ABD2Q8A0_9PLAT
MTFFKAITSRKRNLLAILRLIQIHSNVIISFQSHGMVFTVEDAKYCQAIANFEKAQFLSYEFKEEYKFLLELNKLIELVSLFEGNRYGSYVLELAMEEKGGPFLLKLDVVEKDISTTCSLGVYPAQETVGFNMTCEKENSYIVFPAKCLRRVLQDIEETADYLEMTLYPNSAPNPQLKIAVKKMGEYLVYNLPQKSESVRSYNCSEKSIVSHQYSIKYIRKVLLHCVPISDDVEIVINSEGQMLLRFMLHENENIAEQSVDFYCLPKVEDIVMGTASPPLVLDKSIIY